MKEELFTPSENVSTAGQVHEEIIDLLNGYLETGKCDGRPFDNRHAMAALGMTVQAMFQSLNAPPHLVETWIRTVVGGQANN